MGSKAKILLSINLLLYTLSPTSCDTCTNCANVAPCSYNSSSSLGGGGANVAPCPSNSSISSPPTAYVAPCPFNSSFSFNATLPSGGGGAYVAPCSNNSSSNVPVAPCPRDALKLGVCANLLGKSIGAEVGNLTTITTPCCTLLVGLVDLEVAMCFCTAIRANILGIKLDIPITLNLMLSACGITPPPGFVCA